MVFSAVSQHIIKSASISSPSILEAYEKRKCSAQEFVGSVVVPNIRS